MRMTRTVERFVRDERGSIITTVVIFSVALFVMLGLVIDVGRAYAERTRQQAWIDSVAVAMASQLDGADDAITRAEWVRQSAMRTALPTFGEAAGAAADAYAVDEVVYLTDLPAGDFSDATGAEIRALQTTDPTRASHVLLVAEPRFVKWSALRLLASNSSDGGDFGVAARSVATPVPVGAAGAPVIAICAPDGATSATLDVTGSQFRITKNLDGVWSVGEYGIITNLLDDADGSCAGFTGAQKTLCLMAIDDPEETKTGVIDASAGDGVDVSAALNTRFDIWEAAIAHMASSANVSSDTNTISGVLHDCDGIDHDTVSDSMSLPADDCFHTGTCDVQSDAVTSAELSLYWSQTHGTALPTGIATRYQAYAYEAANGLLDPEGHEDSTNNMCNLSSTPKADRRLIDVALIDCSTLSGPDLAGVTPIGYAEMLLTNPVTDTDGYIITFDGEHQGVTMKAGDIVGQYCEGDPGNHKCIGNSSETPNGQKDWGGGARGMSDAGDPVEVDWPDDDVRRTDPSGRLTYDPYRGVGLMKVEVKRSVSAMNAGRSESTNVPMLFDTANFTGGDSDLQSTMFGNILIVSEDGDETDADDEAKGGWMIFHFDRDTRIESLAVFDTEKGGVIRLYNHNQADPTGEFVTNTSGTLSPLRSGEVHDPNEMAHVTVPTLGDGKHVNVAVGVDGVRTLAYFIPDSGGIDEIEISNDLTAPIQDDSMLLEMVGMSENALSHWSVVTD